jgi:hypothetical protein
MLCSSVKEKHVTACCQLHGGFLRGLLFDPEDGSDMFLQNVSWLWLDYTCVISQKLELFITTVMRISNPSLRFVNVYRGLRSSVLHIFSAFFVLPHVCSMLKICVLKGSIHDQSCCATLRVVQHDWLCMVLIDLIVNGQTCVAQHDWSYMGRITVCALLPAFIFMVPPALTESVDA